MRADDEKCGGIWSLQGQLQGDPNAVLEHRDLGDVRRRFGARQVDPVGPRHAGGKYQRDQQVSKARAKPAPGGNDIDPRQV